MVRRSSFPSQRSKLPPAAVLLGMLLGCSRAPAAPGASPGPGPSASTIPAGSGIPTPSSSATAPQGSTTPTSTALPAPADAGSAAPPGPGTSPPPAPPAVDAPMPAVSVKNIGMHIGGGPNDAYTKEPIAKSVAPHFDDLRRCFAKVSDPKKGGDYSIDLLIDRKGGKAEVKKHRTTLEGEGFSPCVVSVFEGIEFLPPRKLTTMVSYSVRFTPEPSKGQ